MPAANKLRAHILNSQKLERLQLIVCFLFVLLAAGITATTAARTVVLGNNWGTDTLDFLVLLLDLFCELFSFLDHLLDLLLGQTALVIGDGNLLRLTGTFVLSPDVQDAVGVSLESHLNLWLSSRGRR